MHSSSRTLLKSRYRPSNRISHRLLRSYADDLHARVQRIERRIFVGPIFNAADVSERNTYVCRISLHTTRNFSADRNFFIVLWMPERPNEDDAIDYDAYVRVKLWSTGWRRRSADRRRVFAFWRPRFGLGALRPRRDTLRADKVQPSLCSPRPRTLDWLIK